MSMNLDDFRRYSGLDHNDFAPWDRGLVEGLADIVAKQKKGQYVGQEVSNHHLKQGFVDMGNDSPLKMQPDDAVGEALSLLIRKPTSTETFIRDPNGKLNKEQIEKLANKRLDGVSRVSMFGFDSNDGEIYADGPEMFGDGEWGMALTQADDEATNKAVESNPPKVTVTAVKGKTGAGWKITVSKPAQYYRDIGTAAAEKQAALLAKKGIYPKPKGDGHYAYAKIRAKWLKAVEAAPSTEAVPVYVRSLDDSASMLATFNFATPDLAKAAIEWMNKLPKNAFDASLLVQPSELWPLKYPKVFTSLKAFKDDRDWRIFRSNAEDLANEADKEHERAYIKKMINPYRSP
jgi:hypothetical protein